MADFTKPALTSTYTNFITELKGRDDDISSLFSSGSTFTGTYPVRAIRWNASNGYFERRNAANNGFERLEGASGTHKFVNLESNGTISANGAISGDNISVTNHAVAARFEATGSVQGANGFYLPSANQIRFTTNSTDRITILPTGLVGIATVDPAQTLHVNGSARITNGTNTVTLEIGKSGGGTHASNLEIYSDNTANSAFKIARASGTNGVTQLLHNGTGNFEINAVDAADMKFITNDNVRMTIHDGGSISIGTYFTPNDKLHIKEATNNAVYLRVENNDGYARFGTDANDSFIDADVHNLRNRAGSSTYLISDSSLFDIKTAAKVNGALEVTGTITGSITGTSSQADNINIDEKNDNVEYQVSFSDTNGTGFQRQYIDEDDTHFRYNPSTVTLSGININCTNFTATGTVSVTASNSTQLNGLAASSSGNRWGVVPFVDASGVLEAGRYLDFHTSDGSTVDKAGRIDMDGSDFVFDHSIIPTGAINLGSSSARWQNLYVNDLKLSNKGSANDVDGTWGDWTLQEGEGDIFMINNRSGKKFKIAMIPV